MNFRYCQGYINGCPLNRLAHQPPLTKSQIQSTKGLRFEKQKLYLINGRAQELSTV